LLLTYHRMNLAGLSAIGLPTVDTGKMVLAALAAKDFTYKWNGYRETSVAVVLV
jgi:hypothetical protein